MKLTDIEQKTGSKFINRVMKSHFDSKIDVTAINEGSTRTMLKKVRSLISETKSTPKFHSSEKSPAYLQLLMMEQALTAKLTEYGADSARYQGGTAYSSVNDAMPMSVGGDLATDQNDATPEDEPDQDPQVKVEGQEDENPKYKKKTMEDNDEAQLMAGKYKKFKQKVKESTLTESEIETAQVVLAAQDMVDKIGGWMENVADMQYKDLPALVEQIKSEVGVNDAQAYADAQTQTLSTLMTALEQAKKDATNAMAPLTGEAAVDPSDFSSDDGNDMNSPDLDMDLDTDAEPDLGSDDLNSPELDLEPDLGREKR